MTELSHFAEPPLKEHATNSKGSSSGSTEFVLLDIFHGFLLRLFYAGAGLSYIYMYHLTY
jgi:hypothetical protein